MAQKSFFQARSVSEIQELNPRRIYTHHNLVRRIADIGPDEALELRAPFRPLTFKRLHDQSQAAADRREYRHGPVLPIFQPKTQQEAYESIDKRETPLIARMRAFDTLRRLPEEEVNIMGISWHPVQGNDRRTRIVPFDAALEGAKIYAYAEQQSNITVDGKYTQSRRVSTEGATIFCEVPSRTKQQPRYKVNLTHVPVVEHRSNYATVLSLRSQFQEGSEPLRVSFLQHLRFTPEAQVTGSDVHVFTPHEVAAYFRIIHQNWKGIDHTVPLTMNPFPISSKRWARLYDRLNNNIVTYDPTLAGKSKLRHLHLAEKNRLLGRSITIFSPYETAYWDPQRDGKIREYWPQ